MGDPQYRPQYNRILVIGTPQKGTLNFGKPPNLTWTLQLFGNFRSGTRVQKRHTVDTKNPAWTLISYTTIIPKELGT